MTGNMRAHEAGVIHAEGYGAAPAWLPTPTDLNALLATLWPQQATRDAQGALVLGGVSVTDIAEQFGTAAYIYDEADFRARARAFRSAFDRAFSGLSGADVSYAGKAFLCHAVATWVRDEGLGLDVCSGGELAVAARADFPGERITMHGNNKSWEELRDAVKYGVGRIVVDSLDEIELLARVADQLQATVPVLVRVTLGVEAHTHEFIATSHEDQKFGFSLASGAAWEAIERVLACQQLELRGLHSHIGSQIFDVSGFELAARRLLELYTRIAAEHRIVLAELNLGGGYGIAYTSQHDPLAPNELADLMAQLVARELKAFQQLRPHAAPPRIAIEPGRAIAGPAGVTLYRVGTVKPVTLEHAAVRTYVSVDGGMSDNVRTALYGADYSCTLANRESAAPPVIVRVVGKHCESGDIVVMDEYLPSDVRAGDLIAVPATGAYCRSLASQYNHTPRPPVVAVRAGVARLIVRRESVADLLALDVLDDASASALANPPRADQPGGPS